MNGTLSGFFISGLFSFKVSFPLALSDATPNMDA